MQQIQYSGTGTSSLGSTESEHIVHKSASRIMDWRDFRGEGWRLWGWERGLKLHEPHAERILAGYGQLIPLSVFEEAGLEVEKLRMTHCNTAQFHHSVSVIILLFSIPLI